LAVKVTVAVDGLPPTTEVGASVRVLIAGPAGTTVIGADLFPPE
jgi:hypothetical protein